MDLSVLLPIAQGADPTDGLKAVALGVITLPIAVAFFIFEVGLVATLQAFIFATLTAIYLGGAVAENH